MFTARIINLHVLGTLHSVTLYYVSHGHNLMSTVSLEGHSYFEISLHVCAMNRKIPGKTSAPVPKCM